MTGYATHYLETEPTRADVDARTGILLLEFGAPWCGHCQAAQPAIRSLVDEYAQLEHLRIEDARGKPLGRSFRIKLWPTLVLMRGGEELARVVRPVSDADLAPLREVLAAE